MTTEPAAEDRSSTVESALHLLWSIAAFGLLIGVAILATSAGIFAGEVEQRGDAPSYGTAAGVAAWQNIAAYLIWFGGIATIVGLAVRAIIGQLQVDHRHATTDASAPSAGASTAGASADVSN